MRGIDQGLVDVLIREFSHAVGEGYDPRTQIGSQRESYAGLGFGWLYMALPGILGARRILVIGSGRGFSVACLALGAEANAASRVWFVDPGLQAWVTDGGRHDTAVGKWTSEDAAASHFEKHLGLSNIKHLRTTSDLAFETFRKDGQFFDLILIDGDHGYAQAIVDLRHGLERLAPGGLILAHDARCMNWPGVALAFEQLAAEEPDCRHIILDPYPGLGIVQRKNPLLTIRHASAGENTIINTWRVADGVTPRPLPHGDDPRPGELTGDPHEGLFAILDGSSLIGGFGVRRRSFHSHGLDDFIADDGHKHEGYLVYGAVLSPPFRGRRLWDTVRSELLTWTGAEGFYSITSHTQSSRPRPYLVRRVGQTPVH